MLIYEVCPEIVYIANIKNLLYNIIEVIYLEINKAVTAQEMKEIEKTAFLNGMAYIDMMENAGRTAAEEIIKDYNPNGKIALVAVGKGNNGGDGYVVARYLKDAGAFVVVLMIDGFPVTEDAKTNFERCREEGIEILSYQPVISDILIDGADIIVDAIYGAGFHGELNENAALAAKTINDATAKVVALDLPSGLNADDGSVAENVIKADTTVTFARLKCGQTTPNGLSVCGRIILKDIGI